MTPKKKLLIVADTFYPKVDGTLRFMEEFIKRAHDDFEISLLAPHYSSRNPFKEKIHGATYLQPSSFISISGYASCKFSFKNFRLIKKTIHDADIVFIQGPAAISFLSMYYGKKFNKKTIFYTHTLPWELFAKFLPAFFNVLFYVLFKKISIYFFNRCSLILVPYHELGIQLKKLGVKSPMQVAKLGVDIDLFSPVKSKETSREKLGIPADKIIIGYVGRISREKNTEILLSAFKKLQPAEKFFLLMVGDGPEEQTKPFKQQQNCKVTGFVQNVQDYLKAMDVFVMPSLTETTSLATLEAMASGLPVIASKVGFIKSYIANGHNGLFFPRNNAAILSLKIEKLLSSPQQCQMLGQNARRMVAYSFSWERSINKIKRILLQQ